MWGGFLVHKNSLAAGQLYLPTVLNIVLQRLEKDQLKSICKNDKTAWPFVFFLSTTKDNFCHFESAACSSWFIHMQSGLVYCMHVLDLRKQLKKVPLVFLKIYDSYSSNKFPKKKG